MESLNIKYSSVYNDAVVLSQRQNSVSKIIKGYFMQDNQRQALPRRNILPYCSGLIDGDGTIGLSKIKHARQNWDIKINQDEISYFSGLIDCEGSFIIKKCDLETVKKQTNRISPVYAGVIRIGMVSKEPLELLDKTFPGGKLSCEGVRKDRPTYQIMYRWELRKKKLIILALKEIIPFLIAKKEHAITLLKFLEEWENPFNRKIGVSIEELQRRELAWDKMRQLNAVGAAATTKPRSIREDEVIV